MAYYVANQFLTTQEDSDNLNNLIPKFMQEKGSAFILPIKDSYGRWQAMDLSYFYLGLFLLKVLIKLKI